MQEIKKITLNLQVSEDKTHMRQLVRSWLAELQFGPVVQTKMITAASELASNTIEHGGGGRVQLRIMKVGQRMGLKIIFEDEGPGIADLDLAMQDGYSTSKGLGLGLGGSKRLVDDFDIKSQPGLGTCVTIIKWMDN